MDAVRAAVAALAVLLALGAGAARAEGGLANLVWLEAPQALPDSAFLVEDGQAQTFAAFRGRAVVLNFWASWCPPCIAEMPSLDRLAAGHGGQDLAVVAMALDGAGEDDIRAFYRRIGVRHLGIYRDPDLGLAAALGIFGLPTTLLIDHNGMAVARLTGDAAWDGAEAEAVVLPLAAAARRARLAAAE